MKKLAVLLVPVLAVATLAHAGPKGTKYKEHTIYGKNYDRHAVEELLDESDGPAEIAVRSTISSLEGKFKLDKSMPVEEAAVDFIDRHRHAFGLKDPTNELKVNRSNVDKWRLTYIHYQQLYNGVPVWGHSLGVHLTKENDIDMMFGGIVPTPDIDTTPLVTEDEAVEIARIDLEMPSDQMIFQPERKLVIYEGKLAYEVGIGAWRYFINAKDGDIIFKEDIVKYD